MSEMLLVFEQVDALSAQLRRLNRPAADMLQPGIAPFEVEEAVAVAGPAPDDMVSMYGRHDGVDLPVGRTLGDGHVIPGHYWMPVAEALAHHRSLAGLADLWPASWFPIFTDGGGGYLAVICDPDSADYGCVAEFLPGEDEHEIVFDSVSMLLATAVRCFAEGAWRVKGGFLDEDYEQSGQIADLLNGSRRMVDAADYR
jgi:cell wall assembly regulator SMI1